MATVSLEMVSVRMSGIRKIDVLCLLVVQLTFPWPNQITDCFFFFLLCLFDSLLISTRFGRFIFNFEHGFGRQYIQWLLKWMRLQLDNLLCVWIYEGFQNETQFIIFWRSPNLLHDYDMQTKVQSNTARKSFPFFFFLHKDFHFFQI